MAILEPHQRRRGIGHQHDLALGRRSWSGLDGAIPFRRSTSVSAESAEVIALFRYRIIGEATSSRLSPVMRHVRRQAQVRDSDVGLLGRRGGAATQPDRTKDGGAGDARAGRLIERTGRLVGLLTSPAKHAARALRSSLSMRSLPAYPRARAARGLRWQGEKPTEASGRAVLGLAKFRPQGCTLLVVRAPPRPSPPAPCARHNTNIRLTCPPTTAPPRL